MRGAPGEVGSRQSSPYRGSAPIHRRHAANRDTRLPTMFDTPQIPLTPWHWTAKRPEGLDAGPDRRILFSASEAVVGDVSNVGVGGRPSGCGHPFAATRRHGALCVRFAGPINFA